MSTAYSDPAADFANAMHDAGITPPEHVTADGQLHRFRVEGDKNGSRNGWYLLHGDGLPAGAFGSWKSGVESTWCAKRDNDLTPEERKAHRQRMEQAKAERAKVQEQEREKARGKAQNVWDAAAPAPADHPYLTVKGVSPHGLRVRDDGALVVTLRDVAGSIHSLQAIHRDGTKRFLPGGAVTGHYHLLGEPDRLLYLCEGFGTGATIREATGQAVAVAFDCGNLRPVAEALRGAYPHITMVVVADNDQWTEGNPGATKAREAAEAVGARLVVPEVKDTTTRPTDVNDLMALEGMEAVRAQLAEPEDAKTPTEALEDFYAVLPEHKYLYRPTRDMWPASSVNGSYEWPTSKGRNGKDTAISPSTWLDTNRAVQQLTWYPDSDEVINDYVVAAGGWRRHRGVTVYNLYMRPEPPPGDPGQAGPWLDHVRRVYPVDADHIVSWLAHRVQRPAEKLNHALVMGGNQGTGKDTIIEPVKAAIGPWNWSEISPSQMLGRFNGWVKSVIVRVSEARDLGDVDRFAFYDHSKTYIAAPPDVLRVDEKHLREYSVPNVLGLIITSNHLTDGIYLPPDDRRHYVAWSDANREDFDQSYWDKLWGWYAAGGIGHVCAYLAALDLSTFNAKAPPPKTPAWHQIVAVGSNPADSELADVIEDMEPPDGPDALTLADVSKQARLMSLHDLAEELMSPRSARSIPHRMERAGYVAVANPDNLKGTWRRDGRRTVAYARRALSHRDQLVAVHRLMTPGRTFA